MMDPKSFTGRIRSLLPHSHTHGLVVQEQQKPKVFIKNHQKASNREKNLLVYIPKSLISARTCILILKQILQLLSLELRRTRDQASNARNMLFPMFLVNAIFVDPMLRQEMLVVEAFRGKSRLVNPAGSGQ